MGCDIHIFGEAANGDGTFRKVEIGDALDHRSYATFGFLAGVRNYSGIIPIAEPRGFPSDASSAVKDEFDGWGCDGHTPSWLTIAELKAFDYDAATEDRRVTRQVAAGYFDGGCTAAPGEGKATTFREFLGDGFFEDLAKVECAGAERIVFWFDN